MDDDRTTAGTCLGCATVSFLLEDGIEQESVGLTGGENTQSGSKSCTIVQHPRKRRLPWTTRFGNHCHRCQELGDTGTGQSRNQRRVQAICDQEGKENQGHSTRLDAAKRFQAPGKSTTEEPGSGGMEQEVSGDTRDGCPCSMKQAATKIGSSTVNANNHPWRLHI